MLEFPPYFARSCYKVCGVLVSENVESFLEAILLDLAVGCEIFACWAVFDEIMFAQEALGSRIIACGKMYLGKEKGIVRIACECEQFIANVNGRLILVFVHGILPPMFQKLFHSSSSPSSYGNEWTDLETKDCSICWQLRGIAVQRAVASQYKYSS